MPEAFDLILSAFVHEHVADDFLLHKAISGYPMKSLLMWSILMNLPELSMNIWEEGREEFNVMAALTAAYLLRRLASVPRQEPQYVERFQASALKFEHAARKVQLRMSEDDVDLATMYLSSRTRPFEHSPWVGLTPMDVAVLGNCELFVEDCCMRVIQDNFTGAIDCDDEWDYFSWMSFKFVVCILTGGLLAPLLLPINLCEVL